MSRVSSMYELWIVQDGETRKDMISSSIGVAKLRGRLLTLQGGCSDWHVIEKRETTTVSFHSVAASWDEES